MRHLLLATVIAFAVGCSTEPAKNSATTNNTTDSGTLTDASSPDASPTDAAVADSSTVRDTGTPPGDTGTAPDGATTSDTGATLDMAMSPCPAEAPENATACTDEGLQCEYGDDPRESCRTRAACEAGAWALTVPRCQPLPTVTCPMTRDDASGTACEVMDAYCSYNRLVCHCTNCVDGPVVQCAGDPTWMCAVPNPDATCPAAKPRLGEACGDDGQVCNYRCGEDGGRTCRDGSWQASDGGPCPISTAQVKRDIRYLSADELAEISTALQSIPLARYHYTDPSIGRGEKLGFIIEDLPSTTPAVDQQRMMVDLYGYTSMLVADAQAREARMRALEARLVELESKALQCGE